MDGCLGGMEGGEEERRGGEIMVLMSTCHLLQDLVGSKYMSVLTMGASFSGYDSLDAGRIRKGVGFSLLELPKEL